MPVSSRSTAPTQIASVKIAGRKAENPELFQTLEDIVNRVNGYILDQHAPHAVHSFLAGPASGVAAVPSYRAIVPSDVPTLNQNTTGSAATLTTPRAINGVNFDGSAPITIPVGINLIQRIVTSGSQATVDFASIPATYMDLELRFTAKSNLAADNHESMYMIFNNDSTAGNYTITQYLTGQGTLANANVFVASALGLFVNNIPGTGTIANSVAEGIVHLGLYKGTTFIKRMDHVGSYTTTTGANQEVVMRNSGLWRSTAAINRLTLAVATSFVDGSTFSLYGIA